MLERMPQPVKRILAPVALVVAVAGVTFLGLGLRSGPQDRAGQKSGANHEDGSEPLPVIDDITKAEKTEIEFHRDGTRTYVVSGTGNALVDERLFSNGRVTDRCVNGNAGLDPDGQNDVASELDYRYSMTVPVRNDNIPADACVDMRINRTDFGLGPGQG